MSHQVFNIPQTTGTSQGDIYTKHGTSHSHYNLIISHMSQQEVVEVVADVLSQANKAAKWLTTVQIRLLNILKDTRGYFQPILWQSKEVFCVKSWFNQRVGFFWKKPQLSISTASGPKRNRKSTETNAKLQHKEDVQICRNRTS